MSETKKPNNPRWIPMILRIFDEINSHSPSHSSDKSIKFTFDCLEKLLNEGFLTPDQSKTLVRTIKSWIPGQQNFEWNDRIMLTKKQRCDANNRDDVKQIKEYFKTQNLLTGYAFDALKEVFREMPIINEDSIAALVNHIRTFILEK